jgi:putative ABC transport system permease protein
MRARSASRIAAIRAVFWLLRDVTWPSLRRHRLRAALTLVGVVIGVQLFVSVRVIDRATLGAFVHTIGTIAGAADLQIANGDAGVPEALVDRLAAVPGVANASGLVKGTVRTDSGALTVFGVDLFADQRIRETQFPRRHVHIPDELRFANGLDSIALSASWAERSGLGLGDAFEIVGPAGAARFVVRGTLDPVGPTTLFGGAVGLADLPTAQRLLGREGRVDEIDVALGATADRAATIAAIRALAQGVGTVHDPRDRGSGIAGMLGALGVIFALTSMIGLLVGSLLVHHAIQSAILQRRRALAVARALGYRRGAVVAAIFVEAAGFGMVGAILGAALGVAAARLAIEVVTTAVGVIWARSGPAAIVITARDLAAALAVGVGAACAAACGPALAAARLEVVAQLRATGERERAALGWAVTVLGVVCCLVGFAAFAAAGRAGSYGPQVAALAIGMAIVTVGYAVLAPAVVRVVVAAGRVLVARRALGCRLALEQLARDPVRCRGTVGALMAAFAFVLCVSAFVGSLGETILAWIDQAVAADLYVSAGPDLPLPTALPLAGGIENELATIPGVERVVPIRLILAPINGWTAAIRSAPVDQFRRRPFPLVETTGPDYLDEYTRGEAVLLSENLAIRLGLHAGDALTLDTPSGPLPLRVAAVVLDYTMDIGTLMLDLGAYRRHWRDPLVTTFMTFLTPAADAATVRTAIVDRVSTRRPVTVITGEQFKRNVAGAIDGAFVLTYAIQLVAAVIAAIGVLNFFLAEIADRRREIGLLRTVGLDRAQLLGHLTCEAMLIGACGGLLAIAWGWPLARLVVTHSTRLVSGWRLTFVFPWPMALTMPMVVAATAAVAAWVPARLTARTPLHRLVGVE